MTTNEAIIEIKKSHGNAEAKKMAVQALEQMDKMPELLKESYMKGAMEGMKFVDGK